MKHFNYTPILTSVHERYIPNDELLKKYFENDYNWLKEQNIEYQVDVFRWPEFPFFTQFQIAKVKTEITLIIENVNHAVMFRLYSGFSVD